jgi:hypothetical protein
MDGDRHPTMHRTIPTTKSDVALHVNTVKVKECFHKGSTYTKHFPRHSVPVLSIRPRLGADIIGESSHLENGTC